LSHRFREREEREVARVGQVLELVTHAGCQTNRLTAYFGEERAEPCGHCTYCLTGEAQSLPSLPPAPPLSEAADASALAELRRAHPAALGAARQAARFLCGLSSPAVSREKLTRHPLFGSLESRRFQEVLAWCAGG
jgi:ATP-dependent DNA helicase RecQ